MLAPRWKWAMASWAFDAMRAIHSRLSARGFFSQFVGSMIQYRHPQKPELSVGLSVDENPWRAAGKHGEFRFQLTNNTFVPDRRLQEEAQALLNDLAEEGATMQEKFNTADLAGSIDPDALGAMQAACRRGQGMGEAFKVYLKAIHDALKEDRKEKPQNASRPIKKEKTNPATAASRRTK